MTSSSGQVRTAGQVVAGVGVGTVGTIVANREQPDHPADPVDHHQRDPRDGRDRDSRSGVESAEGDEDQLADAGSGRHRHGQEADDPGDDRRERHLCRVLFVAERVGDGGRRTTDDQPGRDACPDQADHPAPGRRDQAPPCPCSTWPARRRTRRKPSDVRHATPAGMTSSNSHSHADSPLPAVTMNGTRQTAAIAAPTHIRTSESRVVA